MAYWLKGRFPIPPSAFKELLGDLKRAGFEQHAQWEKYSLKMKVMAAINYYFEAYIEDSSEASSGFVWVGISETEEGLSEKSYIQSEHMDEIIQLCAPYSAYPKWQITAEADGDEGDSEFGSGFQDMTRYTYDRGNLKIERCRPQFVEIFDENVLSKNSMMYSLPTNWIHLCASMNKLGAGFDVHQVKALTKLAENFHVGYTEYKEIHRVANKYGIAIRDIHAKNILRNFHHKRLVTNAVIKRALSKGNFEKVRISHMDNDHTVDYYCIHVKKNGDKVVREYQHYNAFVDHKNKQLFNFFSGEGFHDVD